MSVVVLKAHIPPLNRPGWAEVEVRVVGFANESLPGLRLVSAFNAGLADYLGNTQTIAASIHSPCNLCPSTSNDGVYFLSYESDTDTATFYKSDGAGGSHEEMSVVDAGLLEQAFRLSVFLTRPEVGYDPPKEMEIHTVL